MKYLIDVLKQVPNLDIVRAEEDNIRTEIQFRVDSNWWTNKLEQLTRSFPEFFFTKRYITESDKFGFRWSILRIGHLEDEMWQDIANRFRFVLLEINVPRKINTVKTSTPNKVVQTGVDKRDNRKVSKVPTYDDDGKEVGDMLVFPIPHIYNELNIPRKGRGGATRKRGSEALNELFPTMGSGGASG